LQTFKPHHLLVIDSSSEDDTVAMAQKDDFKVHRINRIDFNHGATRQLGIEKIGPADIVIFLTQDAILARSDALENLVAALDDESIGCVYGRQLPHEDAGPIATHARLFNYPPESQIKTKDNIPKLGIKAAFMSNSFAAYRRDALMEIGGFPRETDFGEDSFVAARMIMSGYKIAYCADALVYHSHDYSIGEEYRRYFEVGKFHGRESWMISYFGKAEAEGVKFLLSELKYLIVRNPFLIPAALLR